METGTTTIGSSLHIVQKGISYLSRKCSTVEGFQAKLGTSRELNQSSSFPTQIFCSGLILDLLRDMDEVDTLVLSTLTRLITSGFDKQTKTFNFFKDKSIHADDMDTTAVSLWALLNVPDGISRKDALLSAQAILSNVSDTSGIIETFFPPFLNNRGKLDAAALANVLRILYFLDIYNESLEPTERFIENQLLNDNCGYGNGLAYYESIDTFLYFMSNAVELSERAKKIFGPLIKKRLVKRLGSSKYPLDLAMRILTAIKMQSWIIHQNQMYLVH